MIPMRAKAMAALRIHMFLLIGFAEPVGSGWRAAMMKQVEMRDVYLDE